MIVLLLRAISLLAVVYFCAEHAVAQPRYYDMWYFDDRFGLDFRGGDPVPVSGVLSALEGSSTICDPTTGELLFYSDGTRVLNRDHAVMKNGTGLSGQWSSTQSCLIVPDPGDQRRFYIFTTGARTSAAPKVGLSYSIVDMRGDSGRGEVVTKNQMLLSTATEKLVGIRHSVGCGYWIVTHEINGRRFYAWLVSPDGLAGPPVISSAGSLYDGTFDAGYMKASPNGRFLFVARVTDPFYRADGELFRFNAADGTVGSVLADFKAGYGASFSPNNEFLYTADGYSLVQYDLRNLGNIAGSRKTISTGKTDEPFWGMQLGPDGKVYVVHVEGGKTYLGAIGTPNVVAPNVGYSPHRFALSDKNFLGLPNCIDGYLGENNVQSIPDTPRVAVFGDTVICRGTGTQLRAEGGVSYEWSPPDGLNCATCANPIARPAETTTYTVRGYRNDFCRSYDERQVTITVVDLPTADAGEDQTICIGEDAQLQAGGSGAYSWSPAAGLSCTDCPNPIASPVQSTTYRLVVSNEQGCTATDSVRVNVGTIPLRLTADSTVLCIGSSVTLRATGGTGFTWTPATGLSCTQCASPTAAPLITTTYVVRASTPGVCPQVDSITIVVDDPGAADAGADTAICAGESLQLRASGGNAYHWDFSPDLSCLDCPDPVVQPSTTTTYYVATVGTAGCEGRDSVRVVVHPASVIEAGGDIQICGGEDVQLRAGGGAVYRWDFSPDLSCLDCADPIARPAKTTTYYVTGVSAAGCEGRDSVRVVVRPGVVVDAGGDREVCAGEGVQLQARGAERWLWEPSVGLSCTDCAAPVAAPPTTTVYRVRGWNAEGCRGEDTVEVGVRENQEVVRVRIGRGYHGVTGEPIVIGVEVVDTVAGVSVGDLEVRLEYDPTVMLIEESSIERLLSGTMLSGWEVEIKEKGSGYLVVGLKSSGVGVLRGSGDLIRFVGRVYLSADRGTELSLVVGGTSRCIAFESAPGYAEVDSICGLNFRLIELTAQKYVAPVVSPNPGRDRVRFEFGIGLDGPTRLEVFDALGQPVGLLAEDVLEPGGYTVEWNVQDVAAGVYWYRLSSGDWSEGGQVRIDK